MIDKLSASVASCLGLAAVELRQGPRGAGNDAYYVFDPRQPNGEPVAFFRCEDGEGLNGGQKYGLRREAGVLRAAGALGFPVPQVLGTTEAPAGLIMNLVPGTSRPDAAAVEVVGPEYLSLIAQVHAADATKFPVEQYASIGDSIEADLAWWIDFARTSGVIEEPVIALACRVLNETRPTSAQQPSLVHGDVGAGNFMVLDGQVSAMLDWELAHLGDPMEDLAWLWMRGAHTPFGDVKTRFGEYEDASGRAIDYDRLAWHVAFVMLKSCIALDSRIRHPAAENGTLLQLVVGLTYDSLLASQIVRLLGGSFSLLAQEPRRASNVESTIASEALAMGELAPAVRVSLEYLRDAAAIRDWEHAELTKDCVSLLGIEPHALPEQIWTKPSHELLDIANVVARLADRRSRATPKAERRILRAQQIGLGS